MLPRHHRRLSVLHRAAAVLTAASFAMPSLLVAGTGDSWTDFFGNGYMFNDINNRGNIKGIGSGVGFLPCSEVSYQPDPRLICEIKGWTGLPFRTPTSNYSKGRIVGAGGWNVACLVSSGVTADNKVLKKSPENPDGKFTFEPDFFAKLDVDVKTEWATSKQGKLILKGVAENAAAVGIVAWECADVITSRTQLEECGTRILEVFLKGPFDFTDECAIQFPLTTTLDNERVFYTIDSYAESKPVELSLAKTKIQIPCGGGGFSFDDELQPGLYGMLEDDIYQIGYYADSQLTVPVSESDIGQGVTTVYVALEVPNAETGGWDPILFDPIPDNEISDTVLSIPVTVYGILNFQGFENPIRGSGGSPQVPWRTINTNQGLPVKFATYCDGAFYQNTRPLTVKVFEFLGYESDGKTEILRELTQSIVSVTSSTYNTVVDTAQMVSGRAFKIVVIGLDDDTEPFVWIKAR